MSFSLKVKIAFLAVALALLAAACEGGDRNSTLSRADNLMATRPDSALAILERIMPSTLNSDEQRAYHSLLLTQARFRCYQPLDNEQPITAAVEYYRAADWQHDSIARERYTRSLLYYGAAKEDKGDAIAAVRLYRQALDVAGDGDLINRAQLNMRLGVTFYNNAIMSDMTAHYFREARHYYSLADDSAHTAVAMGFLGSIYRVADHSRSHAMLDSAATLAKRLQLIDEYAEDLNMLARCLYYDGDYRAAIAKALPVYRLKPDDTDCRLNLAMAYARLALNDSANFYYAGVDTTQLSNSQQINNIEYQIATAETEGDYRKTLTLVRQQQAINDRNLFTPLRQKLIDNDLEARTDATSHYRDDAELKGDTILTLRNLIVALAIALLALFAYYHIKRARDNRRWQHTIDRLKQEAAQADGSALTTDNDSNEQLRQRLADTLASHITTLKSITSLAMLGVNYKDFRQRFDSMMTLNDEQMNRIEHELAIAINLRDSNALERMKSKHNDVSTREWLLFELSELGFTSNQSAVLLGYKDAAGVRKLKQRLLDKLATAPA